MKKLLVILATVALTACTSAPATDVPTVDSTAVITATVSADTCAVADSCAIDTVK